MGSKKGLYGAALTKKGRDGGSLSVGDMKVPDRMVYQWTGVRTRDDYMAGGGPSVAPNENGGRPDPEFARKKRPLFNQRYYRQSNPHPDYLQGNPDSRREVVQEGSLN